MMQATAPDFVQLMTEFQGRLFGYVMTLTCDPDAGEQASNCIPVLKLPWGVGELPAGHSVLTSLLRSGDLRALNGMDRRSESQNRSSCGTC
jgi:hypothetical protein